MPGARVEKIYESIGFNIIFSFQEVVVAINSDDTEFVKNKDSLQITSKHTDELINIMKQGSLLPIMDKKLDIADFSYNYSTLIREISQAENNQDIFSKRFELAKFLFMHSLYNESLAALMLTKKITPREYNLNLHAQFSNLLRSLEPEEAQEIMLWNNYNEFLIGHSNNSIGFLSHLNKSINYYPDNLYWALALSEVEARLFSNNLKGTEIIFRDLRTPVKLS